MGLALAGPLSSSLVGCTREAEVRPQVLLVVDTDLPVPMADPTQRSTRTPAAPLVDTARIELFRAGTDVSACAEPRDCRHDLALDEESLLAHRVSFGVVTTAPIDVRTRVFRRNRASDDGEPPASAAAEVRVHVLFGEAGVVTQRVFVSGDAWGKTPRADETEPPHGGALPPSAVGTWSGSTVVPCASAPANDGVPLDAERCIPGGAFFRGDPRITFTGNDFGPTHTRLAVMSPFYLDRYEYTVERYLREGLPEGAVAPTTYAEGDQANPWRANCALGNPSPDAPKMALNCLTVATAAALCEAHGRRLPSETEFEYAATGRGEERFFPWGNAPPYEPRGDGETLSPCCDAAVFSRQTPDAGVTGLVEQNECSFRTPEPLSGFRTSLAVPVDMVEHATLSAACAAKRDISRDDIVGLGGGVSEWVRDSFEQADGACWAGSGILRDPVCAAPPSGTFRNTGMGGNLLGAGLGLTGRSRGGPGEQAIFARTVAAGFRCARSDGGARTR